MNTKIQKTIVYIDGYNLYPMESGMKQQSK